MENSQKKLAFLTIALDHALSEFHSMRILNVHTYCQLKLVTEHFRIGFPLQKNLHHINLQNHTSKYMYVLASHLKLLLQ